MSKSTKQESEVTGPELDAFLARLIPAANMEWPRGSKQWHTATSAGQPAKVGALLAVWVQRTQSVRFAQITKASEPATVTRNDGTVWHLWQTEPAYSR